MKRFMIFLFTVVAALGLTCTAYASESRSAEGKVTNKAEMSVIDISLSYSYLDEYGMSSQTSMDSQLSPNKNISMIPTITNEGADCYVRVKLSAVVKKDGELTDLPAPFGVDSLIGLSKDWEVIGDHIYYTKPLNHGDSVDVFDGFKVYESMGSEYYDTSIDVNLVADAVQNDFFTPDFKSTEPWDDLDIEECIREGYDYASLMVSQNGEISVHYDGGANSFVFLPNDFFANFGGMLPGGSYTATANVSNKSGDKIELFFKTNVIEEKQLMDELDLTITQVFADKTEKLLYKGPLNSYDLQNYISLGVYESNDYCDLRYTIDVPAYLRNEYTLETGNVEWYFMTKVIEPPADENDPENSDPNPFGDQDDWNAPDNTQSNDAHSGWTSPIKTGDNANIVLYVALGAISLILLLFALSRNSRKKNSE